MKGVEGPEPSPGRSGFEAGGPPTQRPSVAFMITSLIRGGAQKQMKEVAIRLARGGWDVKGVISLRPVVDPQDDLHEGGVPLYSLDMDRNAGSLMAFGRARRLLLDLQPDLLVTFLFHACVMGSLISPLAGRPAVVSSIRSEKLGGRVRERLFQWSVGLRAATVVNSAEVARLMVSRGIVCARKTHVIQNGVEVDGDRAADALARAELGLPEEGFVWIAVGSLLPAKDYPTLLRAFAGLDQPSAHLVVVGEGPLRPDLEAEARRLGVQDRVRFLGLRGDVPRLLGMADAFVSSSAWEGMPNAIMEAMAMRKPVVATGVGGVPELVVPGETGILAPPLAPERLAEAMAGLMGCPESERIRMGDAGRASMIEKHGWDQVIRAWDRVLDQSLAGGNRPSPTGMNRSDPDAPRLSP